MRRQPLFPVSVLYSRTCCCSVPVAESLMNSTSLSGREMEPLYMQMFPPYSALQHLRLNVFPALNGRRCVREVAISSHAVAVPFRLLRLRGCILNDSIYTSSASDEAIVSFYAATGRSESLTAPRTGLWNVWPMLGFFHQRPAAPPRRRAAAAPPPPRRRRPRWSFFPCWTAGIMRGARCRSVQWLQFGRSCGLRGPRNSSM